MEDFWNRLHALSRALDVDEKRSKLKALIAESESDPAVYNQRLQIEITRLQSDLQEYESIHLQLENADTAFQLVEEEIQGWVAGAAVCFWIRLLSFY